MSDYTQTTDFSAKDDLSSGDSEKLILGSDFDTEFSAIQTAVNSKFDSSDSNLNDINALSDPGADRVLFWDDSASAMAFLTVNTGLAISTTNLNLSHLGIEDLTDPNADRILFWDDSAGNTTWLTANTGLAISGTNLNLSHLGLESLSDPGADRILFWDDSAGNLTWLTANNGLEVSTTNLNLSDVSAGANNPVDISSGTFTFDITALGAVEADGLSSTDTFVVDDGGTAKKISLEHMGLLVQTAQTSQTLADDDANSIMEFNGTASVTIPVDGTHTWPPGAGCIICVDHASQVVTVDGSAVTLNSVFHAGGASDSDKVSAGGSAVLIYLGSDEWYLSGDIED